MKKNHLFSLGRHLPRAFASVVAAGAVTLGSSSVQAQSADEIANNRPTTNQDFTITVYGPATYTNALGNLIISTGTPLTNIWYFSFTDLTNKASYGGFTSTKSVARFTAATPTATTNITTMTGGYLSPALNYSLPGGIPFDGISLGNIVKNGPYIYGGVSYPAGTLPDASMKTCVRVMAETPNPEAPLLSGPVGVNKKSITSSPATGVSIWAPCLGYPRPSLTISSSRALSWPTNIPGYWPYSKSMLGGTNWIKMPGAIAVTNGAYLFKPTSMDNYSTIRLQFTPAN